MDMFAFTNRYVDIGGVGSCGDASVWNATPFNEALENDKASINWPEPRPLPGDPDDEKFPFYLVGDDAFAAKEHLVKPIGRRQLTREEITFNARVSRARRVTENCFGVMACRWQRLFAEMPLSPGMARLAIMAICILHNMVRNRCMVTRDPVLPQMEHPSDGQWRVLQGWEPLSGRRTNDAKRVQETLIKWCNSDVGKVNYDPDTDDD